VNIKELLRFVVYAPGGAFRRDITVDGSADVVPNGISVAEFTLDDDDPALQAVTADGARCAVWFRGVELFRGAITSTPGEGPYGTVEAHIDSDMRKLWQWFVWPVPDADLDHQSEEFRAFTNVKSELIFKTVLQETLDRLDIPWTVAPDHGYGTAKSVELRFHSIGDKVLPLLVEDGLIVTFEYDPVTGVPTVDVRQPDTVPGRLTLESGVPDSYKFNRAWPTATRVIVGGPGDGVDREFTQVVDSAREATWGDIIEGFVDAGNTGEDTDLAAEAQAALNAAAPTVSVSTELVETERFRYLQTYREGDLVRVKVGPVDVTQPITKVSITSSFEQGTVVTPTVGDVDGDDENVQLWRQVGRLAKGQRDQGRR